MSTRQLRQREALAAWLDKRDTAIMEGFLGLAALVIGWRVVDVFDGKPVAPLTGSALFQLSAGLWVLALAGNGVLTLTALIFGLWTGNTYRVRGYVAFFGSIVWSAVAVAVLTAPGPLSVAAGYMLMAVFSWMAFLVLMVRADVKSKKVKGRECA